MGKGQFLEQVWTVTLLGKEKQSKKPETPSLSPGAAFCVSNLKTKVRIKKCGRENGPKFFFFFLLWSLMTTGALKKSPWLLRRQSPSKSLEMLSTKLKRSSVGGTCIVCCYPVLPNAGSLLFKGTQHQHSHLRSQFAPACNSKSNSKTNTLD